MIAINEAPNRAKNQTVSGTRQQRNDLSQSNTRTSQAAPSQTHARGKRFQSLLQKLAELRAQRKARKLERITMKQLLHLDDALLRDIGLSRDDVRSLKAGWSGTESITKHDIINRRDNANFAQHPKSK